MSGFSPSPLQGNPPVRPGKAGPAARLAEPDRSPLAAAGAAAIRASNAGEVPPRVKLAVRNLRKTFGSFVALEGASIDVHEGEFLTLLGPSGSGKTTLLLAIAGLNDPDWGEIRIDDRLATYLPSYKRDIGMVFQNYALFPHMTIFENIAFPLRMRHMSADRIREAVGRVLETIRLPDVGERYPRQLSGGQQQRVALARALVYEPSIVLLDEPLGALDKKLREQLQYEIKRLHRELRLAMLYVTHDQQEALVMSDRICLMRDGRIEQTGTPEDLYFRPQSLFAADFLGESNLLPGRLVEVTGGSGCVELESGHRVSGVLTGDLAVGSLARLMVRPESLRISTDTASENSLPACFSEAIMSGGTTKCFFRGPDGQALQMEVLTGPGLQIARSEGEVRLAWSHKACVILKDE